uniref:Aminotransferase-like plant mobile domain-containing protein n=1 Tax=Setaria italica TaxID=4555 RepID=K3XQJ3_SETIT
MNEAVEFFDGAPSFTDLVDRAMRKYGCRVDEMTLRGRFDCRKARAHYVLMNLASNSKWKHYKDVVHKANVACLEVVVEIVRMPSLNVVSSDEVAVVNRNGTQESEILQHVLGETESAFDLAIANDDFPSDTFERDEANIDDDDISMGSKDSEFEEDGVNELRLSKECDVKLPSVPNDNDISMVHKAICESSMVNSKGIPFSEAPVIKKRIKFKSLEELKFFLADYVVRLHRPFSVVHSNKNLRYNVMCKQGCHWHVWSRLISSTGQWRISNVVQPHTCIIRKDNETSVSPLMKSIFAFSGYRVKYSKAWRAKQHVVALLWGDWKESYGMVPRVLTAMAYYNPGVKCFPPLVHRWCTRYFTTNMSHRQKNDHVIGKLKTLCKVHTETKFNEKLENLVKDLNDDTKEWLKGEMEDKDKWAQAFDEGGMRWGIMTINYSESLNGVFKDIQSRPVSRIIEYSFKKCNAYFVDRWQKARAMLDEAHRTRKLRSVHHLAAPYGQERMVYSIRGCGTINVGGESHEGRHYKVDLNEVLCTCNVPQLLHLPYSHFITACKASGPNYESPLYMSPLYSREHTRNKVGRRQKKRLRGDMDVSQGRLSADYGTGDFDMDKLENRCSKCHKIIKNCTCRNRKSKATKSRVNTYPLLEAMYDSQHRAHHLVDMHERVGFLHIAVQVVAGVPPMDGLLLTAKVDRWRPKTHTFHLPFGEMTITMQDITMILGLPLEGHPVTGIIQNENWCDMVAMHIGIRLPKLEDGDNSKQTSSVEWQPCQQPSRIVFSPMCYRDRELWRCTTPMILYYVVEFHMPHRVMRTKVKPTSSNVPIEHAPSNSFNDIADVYDTVTRYGTQPKHAPLHDYMVRFQFVQIHSEECNHNIRVQKSCRRMPMKMNCMSATDVHHGGNGQGTSSRSCHTPLATPPRTASPSTTTGPSRRSRGKAPASPQASEDSEGNQSDDDDPTYGEDLEMSGMFDAPPVTQT